MKDARMLLALAAGLMPGLATVGHVEAQLPRCDFVLPGPRNSPFRRGRRWGYGSGIPQGRNGDSPAGTKLARKAAKGTLTINAIR